MNKNEICIFALPKEFATEEYVDRMTYYAIQAHPIDITFVRNRRTKDTFNTIVNFGSCTNITNRIEWLLGYDVKGKIRAVIVHADKEDQPDENMWFDVRWADTPAERELKRLKRDNARLKRYNAMLKRDNAKLKHQVVFV